MVFQPLAGVKVLDLTRLLPGPFCSWLLQAMGAEVLKVEDLKGGDYLRFAPPKTDSGSSALFVALNRGRKSVALDLKNAAGKEAFLALVEDADVVLEGFRPGVMDSFGLGPSTLLEKFPRLVVASISGFGQDGPWALRPGHDLNYLAITGALSLGARVDGVPTVPPVQIADVGGGSLPAALGVVAALFGREKHGQGAYLDLSMAEGALSFVGPLLAATHAGARQMKPGGEMLTGGFASYRVYLCADGKMLSFGPLEPHFFATFCAVVGEEVESTDHQRLAAIFATKARDEWVELLPKACTAEVLELHEVLEHPQHKARGMFDEDEHGLLIKPPVGAFVRGSPPKHGEHTEEVLRAAGVDVQALRAAGAIR